MGQQELKNKELLKIFRNKLIKMFAELFSGLAKKADLVDGRLKEEQMPKFIPVDAAFFQGQSDLANKVEYSASIDEIVRVLRLHGIIDNNQQEQPIGIVIVSQTNATTSEGTGSVTVQGIGASGLYIYNYDSNGWVPPLGTTGSMTFNNIPVGTSTIEIRDRNDGEKTAYIEVTITVAEDTTPTLTSTSIIGTDTINEGGTGSYSLRQFYSNGSTTDIASEVEWSANEGNLSGTGANRTLAIPTNSIVGDGRNATVTAVYNEQTYGKEIAIVDTTVAAPSYNRTLIGGQDADGITVALVGGYEFKFNAPATGAGTAPANLLLYDGVNQIGSIDFITGFVGQTFGVREIASDITYNKVFTADANINIKS